MKDKVIQVCKILVSLLLVSLLLHQIDYEEMREILQQLKPQVVVIAILMYLISTVLSAVKWKVLLRDTDLRHLLFLCFRSQLYATVLPGQLFGEASKMSYWKEKNQNLSTVAASIIFDRITGLIGKVLMLIFGVTFSQTGLLAGSRWIFIVLAVLFVLAVVLSSERHMVHSIDRMFSILKQKREKLGALCEKFYKAWCLFASDKTVFLKSIAWGIISQLMSTAMVFYISHSLGIAAGFLDYCWMMPMLSVILMLPVSFAGIGLRDVSLASMLALYGASAGQALLISSCLLLGQLTAAVIGGVSGFLVDLKR